MEVHHHPSLREKKKWGEYLLEFGMIFLGVTAGFFAENIREHISDRNKEKDYIHSFIQNLQDDTAQIKEVISFNTEKIKGIDSFLLLSSKNFADASVQRQFYYYVVKYFFSEDVFKSNDATLVQLRNSGGYLLIEKDHVADSIAAFSTRVNNIYEQASYYTDYYKQIHYLLDEIMDLTLFNDTTYYRNHTLTNKPLTLFSPDPAKMKILFNKIANFKIAAYSYCNSPYYLRGHLIYTSHFIEFLKREYDID
jgi:hypothetical protein